eukprot:2241827-Rhodomonas_salina.1
MSGTRIAYGVILLRAAYAMPVSLRAAYAMSGTGIAYGVIPLRAAYCAGVWCYAVCGNELGYGAMRSW